MLVKCGRELWVNPGHVSTIEWDRGHSFTALIVTMLDGRALRVLHQPSHMDGTDCYVVERELTQAAIAAPREPAEPTAEVVYRV